MKLENSAKQLVRNKQLFEKAVSRAQIALKNGKLNSVIAWAQIGADLACGRHPGFYTSVPLESLLLDVAYRLDERKEAKAIDQKICLQHTSSDKKNVLHVMTEAYEVGGHTRLVSEWIRNTSDEAVHGVVTTAQQGPLPKDLSSIIANGGWYQSLKTFSPDLLTRSCLLRQLSRKWADVVVLHIHPSDALPIVAFGVSDGPPVILFNHAGHMFWLGASVADVVADILPWQQKITLDRRGAKNSKILPIPISKANTESDHEVAKKQFGIKNDTITLLTIGSEYKYTPFAGYDFVNTMVKILRRNSNVVLFAVGPRQQGRWAKASAIVGGRIRAMGLVDFSDLPAFYDVADIYVDSFPLAGGVALLEAGVRGIPIIGLREQEAPNPNLSDDISLEKFDVYAPSLEAFTISLENMIAQPSLCSHKTTQIKESIEAKHCPPGWNNFLDDIMGSLPSEHTAKLADPSNRPMDQTDLFLAGFEAAVRSSENTQNAFGTILVYHARNLSKDEQIRNFPEMLLPAIKLSLPYLRKILFTRQAFAKSPQNI